MIFDEARAGEQKASDQPPPPRSPLQRRQGLFTQPEPPKAATWHLNDIAARVPEDIARKMPHGCSLYLPDTQLKILLAVPELIALGEMGLVLGPAGVGKSVLLGAVRAACPHRVAHVDLRSQKTSIGMAQAVFKALTGVETTIPIQRGPDPIWRAVEVELNRTTTLLVVDEIHRVVNEALLELDRLALRTAGRFGVLAAGLKAAEPRLRKNGEVWRRFAFRENLFIIPRNRLHETLSNWHPLLEHADPSLLKRIDAVMCKGSWGEWKNFVVAHQGCWGRDAALTEKTARMALARYSLQLPKV